MKHVFILQKVEYMETQHTGLDESAEIVAVFSKLPEMPILAGYIQGLPSDMGLAIAHVNALLKSGEIDLGSGELYRLAQYNIEAN